MQVRKGFTLVEILAVMGIIIILMALVLPTVTSSMQKANIAAAKASLEKIEMAVRNFESAFGYYPSDLSCENLGVMKTSRNFGAVRPVLQYEKNQTVDEDGNPTTTNDIFYKDPWGNRFFFVYYDDNGVEQGDDGNKDAANNIAARFKELCDFLKSKDTKDWKFLELILDRGPRPTGFEKDMTKQFLTQKLQQGFLIWSAGPDTLNGSDDDIGNWGFTRNKMT